MIILGGVTLVVSLQVMGYSKEIAAYFMPDDKVIFFLYYFRTIIFYALEPEELIISVYVVKHVGYRSGNRYALHCGFRHQCCTGLLQGTHCRYIAAFATTSRQRLGR
jgi:hypothetical protein